MILDLDDFKGKRGDGKSTERFLKQPRSPHKIPSLQGTSQDLPPIIPHPNQIIIKILHTRTELRIYPNGQTYQNSKSWFEGGFTYAKPKKKKTIQKTNTKQRKEEVY